MKGKSITLASACFSLALASSKAGEPAPVSDTHAPDQLGDFVLPEMILIDGLKLDAALEKLKAAYEDVCRKTGETPLALTFAVPPEAQEELHLKLYPESFADGVRLLASVAGVQVERKELEYRFKPLEGDARVTESIQVPPDFASQVGELAVSSKEKRQPIGALLADIGLTTDPLATVSLSSSGKLTLSNISKADAAAIKNFIQAACSHGPKQIKFVLNAVELEKNAKVTVPKSGSAMTEGQAKRFLATLKEKSSVEVSELPAVTARIGMQAVVDMGRDFPDSPQAHGGKIKGRKAGGAIAGIEIGESTSSSGSINGEVQAPDPDQIGKAAVVEGTWVGLKLNVKLQFMDRVGEIDTRTKEAVITNRTDITESGLYKDGGTRIFTQTRTDGTRTLLLAQAEIIDATGRPYRKLD